MRIGTGSGPSPTVQHRGYWKRNFSLAVNNHGGGAVDANGPRGRTRATYGLRTHEWVAAMRVNEWAYVLARLCMEGVSGRSTTQVGFMWIERFRKLSTSARVASLASVAAVAVWSAILIAPDVNEDGAEEAPAAQPPATQPSATQAPVAQPPAASQPPVPAAKAVTPLQPANKPAQPSEARATLREALASDNSGARIDALRTLAERRRVEVLPELLTLDVARDPEIAPTVFQVTGRLAQHADPAQRGAAFSQLSRWLQSESARDSADARGNVSVLVETLADFQAPEAERALIGVLQSEQQALHVKTLAVEGLAKLGTPAAQTALTQFRAQLGETQRQGFELELQREAEQAADRALARLSR